MGVEGWKLGWEVVDFLDVKIVVVCFVVLKKYGGLDEYIYIDNVEFVVVVDVVVVDIFGLESDDLFVVDDDCVYDGVVEDDVVVDEIVEDLGFDVGGFLLCDIM